MRSNIVALVLALIPLIGVAADQELVLLRSGAVVRLNADGTSGKMIANQNGDAWMKSARGGEMIYQTVKVKAEDIVARESQLAEESRADRTLRSVVRQKEAKLESVRDDYRKFGGYGERRGSVNSNKADLEHRQNQRQAFARAGKRPGQGIRRTVPENAGRGCQAGRRTAGLEAGGAG